MLNGKALIIATKPYAKEDRAKSWRVTIVTLLLLIAAITATVVVPYIWLKLVFSVLAGLLNVRMFIIYHDFQHHTILNHSKPANALMTVFGLYVLAPASIWKRSHDYHHKHNSKLFSASIGSYPIATKQKFMAMSKPERRAYLATRHPLTILFGYFSMFMLGMCFSSFTSSPKKHTDSLIALILHFTATALLIIFAGWQTWLFALLIPSFIGSAIGAYLFYAQHNFPGVIFSENEGWTYEKAALQSSSYMTMSGIMHWFTGNIGYHHIHHLNARIPFYRLPETLAAFPELQRAKTTSLNPKDIIACLKLKVWDPELQRMVGRSEIEPVTETTCEKVAAALRKKQAAI